ncbi:enoyl-CoA hydratase [Corynebacterium jeikeium ATCC 43734]|nr:enoyl-CoA hydratase [Corynebacterium jeikeium ATCC 43734]OOD29256.1 hypothetical protein BWP03_10785 [Corynebacterium jeikeium]
MSTITAFALRWLTVNYVAADLTTVTTLFPGTRCQLCPDFGHCRGRHCPDFGQLFVWGVPQQTIMRTSTVSEH